MQHPYTQHRVPRQPLRQTKDDHMTTETTQAHMPSSKNERNLTILQVNINGIKNKLEELKLLFHDTHADIITIQETKVTPTATPKLHNFTTVRTNRLLHAGGGDITLIRDNITFTTTDIPSTINTHHRTSNGCCMPSETYGRNGVTPIFRSIRKTASSTTCGWSRWNI